MSLRLRPANANDARLLWSWANDPNCRKNAFDSNPIEWPAHRAWLDQKLAAPDCRIWILEKDGQSVGQIRYDCKKNYAEIDFAVAPGARGQGLGITLLQLSALQACHALGVEKLIGLVKGENQPSIRAFKRAGFEEAGTIVRNGELCFRFEHACV
jgi:UDP-2,4-diacetamido-2,4,6-trideoxy-beta-L-altropyranose hydrolase